MIFTAESTEDAETEWSGENPSVGMALEIGNPLICDIRTRDFSATSAVSPETRDRFGVLVLDELSLHSGFRLPLDKESFV